MTPEIELIPIDEDVLDRLVAAAVSDAAADEVTPPLTPGADWTPERLEWMRGLHRGARAGLDGPDGQATWAVVAHGAVVGAPPVVPGKTATAKSGKPEQARVAFNQKLT